MIRTNLYPFLLIRNQIGSVFSNFEDPDYEYGTGSIQLKIGKTAQLTQCCGAGGAKLFWDLEPEPKINL